MCSLLNMQISLSVSLVRKDFCEFALDRLEDSADLFDKALALCPTKNATRAKFK